MYIYNIIDVKQFVCDRVWVCINLGMAAKEGWIFEVINVGKLIKGLGRLQSTKQLIKPRKIPPSFKKYACMSSLIIYNSAPFFFLRCLLHFLIN